MATLMPHFRADPVPSLCAHVVCLLCRFVPHASAAQLRYLHLLLDFDGSGMVRSTHIHKHTNLPLCVRVRAMASSMLASCMPPCVCVCVCACVQISYKEFADAFKEANKSDRPACCVSHHTKRSGLMDSVGG